jgi:hypothetical protein
VLFSFLMGSFVITCTSTVDINKGSSPFRGTPC